MATDKLVLPVNDPAVLDYRQRAVAVRDEANALVIDTAERKTEATAFLGRVARLQKDAEAKRTELVKPHNDYVKGVNDLFRQTLGPVFDADRTVRGKVLQFDVDQRRKAAAAAAQAERERLEAEALLQEAEKAETAGDARVAEGLLSTAVAREQAAKVAAVQAAPIAKTTRDADTGAAATVRKTWAFKVVDLAQVPRSYFVLDESLVREAIRQGVRQIPGLEIFEQESLSVRPA